MRWAVHYDKEQSTAPSKRYTDAPEIFFILTAVAFASWLHGIQHSENGWHRAGSFVLKPEAEKRR